MASSDIISQKAFEKREIKQMEPLRIGRFALLGTCFVVSELCI